MKHLKSRYSTARISAKTIQEIDEEAYRVLHSLVPKESLSMGIFYPVQYDDIVWRRLNR